MSRDFTFKNFLKDLGMRFGAVAVVVGIFFGLGYIKRMDFLGLSSFLDSQISFFGTGFFLVTVVAITWILYQQSKLQI